jgi:ferredoxin-thioredoxin reductase catalytic chain
VSSLSPEAEEQDAGSHTPQAERMAFDTTTLRSIFEHYADQNGLQLNPHAPTLQRELEGLTFNLGEYGYLYCPCRMKDLTGDPFRDKKIVCPCAYHKPEVKSDGHCKCELFVAPLGEDPDLISTTIHRVEIRKKLQPGTLEIEFVKPGRSKGEVKIWIPQGVRQGDISVESDFDHAITEKNFQNRILFFYLDFEERAVLRITLTKDP